jgi:hypothetical protein
MTMAYVRKRSTKAGSVSTTLIEAYRDESGRPRQRVLANLHGEPDTLRALAKLALMHDALLEQREEERAESSNRGAGFVLVTERALTEHNRHMVQIDRQLAAIERDMAAINKHCTASDDEFEEAVQRYKKEYCKLFDRALALAIASKQANAALRRKGLYRPRVNITGTRY